MQGKEIKELIQKKRLHQWEVAEELNINEFTLSAKMIKQKGCPSGQPLALSYYSSHAMSVSEPKLSIL